MLIYAKTHQGLVRANNQDSLLIAHNTYGVADGMGGHKGGETASRLAVQVMKSALSGKEPDDLPLRLGFEAANRRVYETQKRDPELSGMGTTMTLLWEGENEILIGHVGDSRAYLLRNGVFAQQTEDHSVVAELVRNHVITPEAALKHPYRNVITRALGPDASVRADIYHVEKQQDDIWLVCSDGLYNMVDDASLGEALASLDCEQAAERLLALAIEHGGSDNVSLIIGKVTGVNAE